MVKQLRADGDLLLVGVLFKVVEIFDELFHQLDLVTTKTGFDELVEFTNGLHCL
jgi:hypothetical protein